MTVNHEERGLKMVMKGRCTHYCQRVQEIEKARRACGKLDMGAFPWRLWNLESGIYVMDHCISRAGTIKSGVSA